jgi:amino acid adenylation domain-containing protein
MTNPQRTQPTAGETGLEIAIVGMAGRFPGARNVAEFWHNLRNGVESISFFSEEQLLASGQDPEVFRDPAYMPAQGVLQEADLFDPEFFGYTPREAEIVDPQQRVFLECCWEALEDAGYEPQTNPGPIGVYGGVAKSTYVLHLLAQGSALPLLGRLQLGIANDKDYLCTRVSYKLNLEGPSVVVQSACSTSLVAVHLAAQALLCGECDMALAGGVAISFPQQVGYLYRKGGPNSPDGHCRAFDARAQGMVGGHGVGVLVLKRLADARTDGDSIRAVIKGSAINNDGGSKAGYTAPRVEGQCKAILAALQMAEVDAQDISYVEAHGTGTELGDLIEVAALTEAFRIYTGKRQFCALGSVKTNIGHLDVAAGVASLIKAVLCLEHGEIPPSLHFESPNPAIDFASSPFYVNAELRPWPAGPVPRRAGVSSFGIGGTNAHLVLEEAPPVPASEPGGRWQLLVLSARSGPALEAATDNLARHLRERPDVSLADMAWTLQTGRAVFEHRRAVVAGSVEEAVEALKSLDPERVFQRVQAAGHRPVTFLFPGQGSQYPGMGAGLYETEPVFRREVDRCLELLEAGLAQELRSVLFPGDGGLDEAAKRLARTEITQPALFVIEYALARLWMEWGVRPQALLGHSVGEYVAACLAGVMTLEEALRLVAARGRLIGSLPGGAMLSVNLPERELLPSLGDLGGLDLAAVNGPSMCVASGPVAAVEDLERRLTAEGVVCRRLHTSHAFHSAMMEPILEAFTAEVRKIRLRPPEIPFLSNLTGTWITEQEATDPGYFVRHLRQSVRLAEGIDELCKGPRRILLEVGPGKALGSAVLQQASGRPAGSPPVVSCLRYEFERQEDVSYLLRSLGQLWLQGADVDWAAFHGEPRRRVPLPTYPFERRRFFVEPPAPSLPAAQVSPRPLSLSRGRGLSIDNILQEMTDPRLREGPKHSRPARSGAYEAPRDPIERQLAELWQQLLGIEPVGIHDNFFDLGGHSLLGIQLLSRIRETLHADLPLRVLFEMPSLAEMAAKVAEHQAGPATGPVPELEPSPDGDGLEVLANLDLLSGQQLDALISELLSEGLSKQEKRDLLERFVRQRTSRSERGPLSFGQQRLWFIDQLTPGNSAYHVCNALRFQGDLSWSACAASLDEIVRRHKVLRTTFTTEDDQPVQVVASSLSLLLPIVDLEALPELSRLDEARRLASLLNATPFDLRQGPLLRVSLVRTGESDSVLLMQMHHIVSDGWSLVVLANEFTALYEAFSAGRLSPLPALRIQYLDFARWQRRWLRGEALESQLRYWRERLAGSAALELATDRPHPPVQSYRGAEQPFAFSVGRDALAELGRGHRATPFMILLAAFQVLLSRLSEQQEVSVGSPVANRNRKDLEALIGFFVNTIVLRVDLAGDPTFAEALERVREVALGAYAHQETPFELVVGALQPERDLSRPPLFQVMFTLHNVSAPGRFLPDLEVTPFKAYLDAAQFELSLQVWDSGDAFGGALAYNRDLFDRTTVRRLLAHFDSLLSEAVADPRRRIGELALLGADERHQLLSEWNSACQPLPEAAGVEELLAAQAGRTPDAIAVRWNGESLSYAELDQRAGSVACGLYEHGAGLETLVALFLPRSIDFLVAILGVFKAGAAYLPFDPQHPAARSRQILEQSGATLILTSSGMRPRLAEVAHSVVGAPRVLEVGELSVRFRANSPPPAPAAPTRLAYVIYTSGSTGVPKGAMVGQLDMINHLLCKVMTLGLEERDTVAQTASQCFDVSVWQSLAPLLIGARVMIFGDEIVQNPVLLVDELAREGVTVYQTVPSLLGALLDSPLPETSGLSRLRWQLVSGEALSPALATRWCERFPGLPLINAYGPTECSDNVCQHVVFYPLAAAERTVPIGHVLPNCQLYVLDRHQRLQPAGTVGELYAGGIAVGRGYLGDPRRTAEVFVPDPFAAMPGARLYRTGDLTMRRANGEIDFFGRRDGQVKIRGFRIELGEIEAVLTEQAGVRDAVVVALGSASEDRRLVAYTVGDATADTLRQALRQRLPGYMVPAAFMALPALPHTPNGKVDRKALPAPESHFGDENYQAPRTPVEEILAGIWSELLGLERVGADDHFFDLGGHSLLATRVMSRLRGAFGVEVPLHDLFAAPRLADLAARVETARGAGAIPLAPPLLPTPREAPVPLSFAQQRLWFIDQLEPGSPLYNIPVALRVEGPLDGAALALCLGEIVRRHEVLRTIFAAPEGSPVQVIRPAGPFRLTMVDLSGLPESRRETVASTLAGEEAGRPFDLSFGPLLRCVLLRLAEEDHAVTLTMHHIVSDGWSMGILVREVAALYPAFAQGKPSSLPELPVQYADFAVWQSSWLQGEILDQELAWWRRQLAGLPPLLELPTDRPRPAVQGFRGATRPVRLPAALTRQVEALGRREEVTLFMVLLAGFQALLSHYSGQLDLALGTPIAGRNRLEIEDLIGFFVNTLVLRGDLTGEPSFRAVLGRVRESALAAHLHQDVPFEKLVEELAPERSLAHSPLFQVMLVLQNAPEEELEIEGLRLRSFGTAGRTVPFDLTLSLQEQDGRLIGGIGHRTDLFDRSTIERLIGHFERLLAAAVAEPERRVADLPLLSPGERHQVLTEWNDTGGEESWEGPVTFLVERWFHERPDAPAVVDVTGHTLTYGALGERSGRLAGFLRALGVGPESIVAVLMERSPELLVGQLGVLKAGAAYLSLDPAHPAERLAFMLAETVAPVVLTQESLLPRLIDRLPGARIVCLDRDLQEIALCSSLPALAVEPEHLAYVLYTSGSTGRPKGVQIPHRGLLNLVRWDLRTHGTGPGDHRTQVASLGFDAAVWEIWACLASGATLHLPAQEARLEPAWLAAWMARRGITVSFLPTPLAEALLADGGPQIPSLRRLLVGGDRLRLRPEPGCSFTLINHYGPAEASVVTSAGLVLPCQRGEAGASLTPSPTLGRPIDGLRVCLLDWSLQPVPPGVAGELWVSGPAIARGYLGDPERTAERFLPDPWGTGERLYRTGDLCRYRRDGEIEFLGRVDRQVKIRGQRIELGEIEAALTALPGVREAVVVAREDVPGDKRLVAYVVGEALVAELRERLRERLPDYMVPAAFVPLDALPLTPNGKVDRKALPAPEWRSADTGHLAPRTPVEEVLAGIWAQLLGRERVGAHDHFFELGGHSLLATQVMSRLRRAFGIEMPLRDLFEAPVLADLAARVKAVRRTGTISPAPLLLAVPREGHLPLSFAQQRLWFIDQLEPGSPLYNMPVALRVAGPLASGVLARALGEVVRRHEVLRTIFAAPEGSPVQVIRPAGPFRLPVVDLAGLPESRRETVASTLAGEESGRPFDLSCGPLLRCVLLRLAEVDHVVTLTMHHIVSDGWSMGILVREVAALYAAFAQGQLSPLPELPVQYADFAVWQSSWLQGEILEQELAWWRRQLAGLPALLELPTDRPRPALQSYRGATRPVRLAAELIRQAEALGRRQGATLFMVLLAGFQALLARYSGQQDLAVGSPIAGRNQVEVEELIGFFVNTLVLRGDLSGAPVFGELLGRARETALASYLHQDVPFEKLVEELAPERSLAHPPLFQVMLVLQNVPGEILEIRDLHLRPVGVTATTAKFDLTVSLMEQDGGLLGAVEHATDLYDGTTVDRLIGHFERLLAAALSTPDEPVSALSLLSPEEHGQIVVEWNDTRGVMGALRSGLYELFEAQVRRTPEAVAVVFGEAALTYGELGARAGRFARHLRRLGVGPDVLVGLLVERSLDMIVGVLGILRAGGAYVPLDPSYPAQRRAFMLEDSRAPVLLTQAHLRDRLPADSSEILLLDGDDGIAAAGHTATLGDDPVAENLAYLIYTSGSTGRPKGVSLSHRALRNLIDWHLATLLGGARTLQFASLSFDASFHEMFACWGSGGTLVVVPEELRRDMPVLAELLVEQQIEKAILPVVVLQQLAETFTGHEDLPPLREITTTGERLQTNRAMAALLRRLPRCAFHNHYGPSETHVATAFTLRPDPEDWPLYPPIGRPIGNSSTYVVGPGWVPVPIGVPGDLYIGGVCLARGYWRRPGLTAQKFVPDPFGGEPGARLYQTGDKVRLLANGDLEFLGRFDDQVKIRGFRIELGEIEALLLALPGVRAATVVVREDRSERGAGDRRLVAYVAGDVAVEALRRWLRERLPDYMVPAAFMLLAALPLTPNGKVDRKALPAPAGQSSEETYLAPHTPVEEMVAGIWAEVLGLERVGVTDHFFELGGHSLLATRVMSRLRSVFEIEMPLRVLFEAPRLATLAVRVEEALRAGAGQLTPPLVPVPHEGTLPLSFAQQRLWFIDQLEPGSPLYNIPVALRVEGPLDGAALALCLGEIVRRHETLRTIFAAPDGSPVQRIQPAEPFRLSVVDLSELPEPARDALTLALVSEETGRPFDLARGPLLRGVLLRRAEEDHVVTLTMHHIVSDGWSMGILVREVAALYAAFAQGKPSPLPELPVQYADFAVWQSSWLQGEILEQELAWWRRQLAGLPALLELPTDRLRPAVQSYRGATRPVRLPAALTRQIEALGRREGATLFMVLLAGFQALLARYSGQQDLAVGSPVAGRNRIETEGLIGFFVNTLVLRGDLSGHPTLQGLLCQVREMALAAYMHQDLPFEKLVEELAPERSLAHAPLFQVTLVLQNAPGESLEIEDLRLRPVNVTATTAKLDLTLSLAQDDDGGLSGTVEYATDLYDTTTVDRLIGHLERLLAAAAATPDLSCLALPLLHEAEFAQLSIEWNDTRRPFPENLCLHDLFAASAERRNDAVAAIFADRVLTYGELARRASAVANSLQAAGMGLEMLVGICLDEGLERLVAVLGVFLAGAAYLPLDPSHPRERLAYMIEDASVRVVLTGTSLLGLLPGTVEAMLLEEPQESGAAVSPPGSPLDLAYVIYTSGSTGRPRGVMVTHGSAVQLILHAMQQFRVEPSSRILQSVSFSFDASILETWMAFAAGATLCIASQEARISGEALAQTIRDAEISTAVLTPAVLTALSPGELPRLRVVSVGGDRCPPELASRWAPPASGLHRLLNCYGPTETTVYTVAADLQGAYFREPPIGRPVANARVYILCPSGGPVPAGVPGELCVAGPGLARGYLNQPALTAERFVPDPFGRAPGGRLYRTGDLCRHQHDGNLEFLGRIDRQVKIRGFRIELGEIEAELSSLPGVHEAVVTVHESAPGDRRLVAYVTGEASSLAADALRRPLRERLPDFMVPSAFVPLAALPLTPTGKIDRQALSRQRLPAGGRPAGGQVRPRNLAELAVAQAFEDVLGVPAGAEDDFFALGGHSLLSVRLMARIRQRSGRDLPLAEIFAYPTVAALARRLNQEGGLPWSPLVPIQPHGGRTPLFCVHPLLGEVLCYYHLARRLGTDHPFYGIRARPMDGQAEASRNLIEEMAAEYLQAVRSLQPAGPYLLAGFSFGGIVAFEMAQQLARAGEEVALLALLDTPVPLGDETVEVDTTAILGDFLRKIALEQGQMLALEDDELRILPFDDQIARGLEILGSTQAPSAPDLQLLRHRVLGLSARVAAVQRYKVSPYPGKISLFRARDIDPDSLQGLPLHYRPIFEDPSRGWGRVAARGVEVHTVPGDHNAIVEEPYVEALAEILGACLTRAEQRTAVAPPLR